MTDTPAIIEVGLNEAITRAQHPAIPYTPADVAADAARCADAGAAVVHWHARGADGEHRPADLDLYAEALDLLRSGSRPDVIGYPTYPTQPADDLEARLGHVWALGRDHGLELAPVDVGSINVIPWDPERRVFAGALSTLAGRTVVQNSLAFCLAALEQVYALGMTPTVASFDVGFTRTVGHLMEAGHLRPPVHLKIFFGETWAIGPRPTTDAIDFHLTQLPPELDVVWQVVPYTMRDPALVERLCRHALEHGGGVRVGVGDNPAAHPDNDNPGLVERAARWAEAAGRTVATPADVRTRLGLRQAIVAKPS